MANEAAAAGKAADNLYVQLIGDGRSYQNMLNGAIKQTEQAGAAIAAETSKITAAVKNDVAEDSAILAHMTESRLAKVGQRAVGSGLVMVSLVRRLIGAFQSLESGAISAFKEAELAVVRMNDAIESNGGNVEKTSARYEAFAAHMQEVSTLSATAAKQLLAVAESAGLSGDAAERAVKDAQALAAKKGGSAGEWMQPLAFLEKGQIHRAFMRLTPEIRAAKTEMQKLALVQKYLDKAQSASGKELATATGHWRQFKNEVSDVLEVLGKTIIDALRPVVQFGIETSRWFKALSPQFQKIIAQVVQWASLATVAVAAWGMFGGAIKDIVMLIAMLVSKFGLLIALAAGVGYAIYKIADSFGVWDDLKKKMQGVVDWFKGYFQEGWDGIVSAVKRGDLEMAWNIALAQIKLAWVDATNALADTWDKFVQDYKIGIDKMIIDTKGLKQAWETLKGGAATAAAGVGFGAERIGNEIKFAKDTAKSLLDDIRDLNKASKERGMSWASYSMNLYRILSGDQQSAAVDEAFDNLNKNNQKATENFKQTIDLIWKWTTDTIASIDKVNDQATRAAASAAAKRNLQGLLDQAEEDKIFEGAAAMWMDLVKPAEEAGKRAGKAFSDEFKKAMRVDAVEFFSLEGQTSMEEFLRTRTHGGEGKGKGGMGGPVNAAEVNPQLFDMGVTLDGQASTAKHMDGLLAKIERNTGREQLVLTGAGLG